MLLGVHACFLPALFAHEPITTKVTWNKEVVRILSRRCWSCHSEHGFAQIPLTTYEEARPWAKAIKEEILEHRMPIWHAARGFGEFANDRSLTQLEKDLLVDWVEGGAPRGEGNAGASPAPLPESAGASPAPASVARWISGWEFRPDDPAAVDEAELWIETAQKTRIYLGNWTAGEGDVKLPEGVAQMLPAGARVVARIKNHEGRQGGGKLFLSFAEKPPEKALRHRRVACGATPLPAGAEAFALRPLDRLEAVARRPDGVVEILGRFDKPRFFQPTYRFRSPIPLAGGTSLDLRADGRCAAMLSYLVPRTRARGQ